MRDHEHEVRVRRRPRSLAAFRCVAMGARQRAPAQTPCPLPHCRTVRTLGPSTPLRRGSGGVQPPPPARPVNVRVLALRCVGPSTRRRTHALRTTTATSRISAQTLTRSSGSAWRASANSSSRMPRRSTSASLRRTARKMRGWTSSAASSSITTVTSRQCAVASRPI